jgi:gamma-glutamylcyclotransferase (GGCT)/AIG2-like uncharacterized protein YtfP
MQSAQKNVFVYGTLKRGGTNHSLLLGQRFVAIGHTRPVYKLYSLNAYPALIEVTAENGRSIEGEIWQVDPTCLARLDELEGVEHGIYARVPIALLPPNDTINVESYIYLRSIVGRSEIGEVWPV